MRAIAFIAAAICTLVVMGQLDSDLFIFNQSYQLVATLVAGLALAYVTAMS